MMLSPAQKPLASTSFPRHLFDPNVLRCRGMPVRRKIPVVVVVVSLFDI